MRTALIEMSAAVLLLVGCGGDNGGSRADDAGGSGREVAIATSDALKFDPSTVTAKAGETVTFVITNPGRVDHEFAIGSAGYLSEHAKGSGHGGHGGGEGGEVVSVDAGKTARLTFTMPDDAPSFACHVDQHDQAGMTGAVVYS